MRRTRLQKIMMGLGALLAAMLLLFGWMGYLGGDPFTVLRPEGYSAKAGAPVAIIFSGDNGFRLGLGKRVAHRLEQDDIPVIGVNSLTYFRQTRTAAETALLIEGAISRAKAVNPSGRIILIGQSFGADMLHVGLAKLPEAQRREVALVALVVPGATVEYRASPSEIFTFMLDEHDALPSARQLDWAPLLCIYGAQESHSLCPLLHQRNARVIRLPGGHQLNWDTDAIEQQIKDAMKQVGLFPDA